MKPAMIDADRIRTAFGVVGTVVALCVLGMVSGCGQKGPLTPLPPSPAAPAPGASSPDKPPAAAR